MAQVIVPDWVQRNLRKERMLASADEAFIKDWNSKLQEIDPSLALAFGLEGADAPGVIPGRWHVRKRNPMGPDTYWPILADDGGFREMDSGVLDAFRRGDHQNDRANRIREREDRERELRVDKDRELTAEQRQYELARALRTQFAPQVSFHDRKWTNSAKGRRG